jgi:fluoride exporter
MLNLIAVFLGGALWAITRYMFMNNTVFAEMNQLLIINTLGSFLIGFLFQTFQGIVFPLYIEKFLVVGFIGGFTAFSAYSLDIVRFIMDFKLKEPIIYIFLINFLAFAAVYLGMLFGKYLKLFFGK